VSIYPAPETVEADVREHLREWHPIGDLILALQWLHAITITEDTAKALVDAVQTIDGIIAGDVEPGEFLELGEQLYVTPSVFLDGIIEQRRETIAELVAASRGAIIRQPATV
jgi:hypothetical protein